MLRLLETKCVLKYSLGLFILRYVLLFVSSILSIFDLKSRINSSIEASSEYVLNVVDFKGVCDNLDKFFS